MMGLLANNGSMRTPLSTNRRTTEVLSYRLLLVVDYRNDYSSHQYTLLSRSAGYLVPYYSYELHIIVGFHLSFSSHEYRLLVRSTIRLVTYCSHELPIKLFAQNYFVPFTLVAISLPASVILSQQLIFKDCS